MRTSHVAKALNIDPKTVAGWTDNELLNHFFSPGVTSVESHQRVYTEGDLIVLNTIRVARQSNKSWEEISEILSSGDLDRNVPISSLLVKSVVPAAQLERFLALTNDRDAALKEVERLKVETTQKDQSINELQLEVRRLNREIGRLEGKIEAHKDKT